MKKQLTAILLLLPCTLMAQSNAFNFVANSNIKGWFELSPKRGVPYPVTQWWNGYQNQDANVIVTTWTSPYTGEVVQCPYWLDSNPYNNTGDNPGYDSQGNAICPQFSAGGIDVTSQPTRAGIAIPFQLGYPNNGFLPACCTITYGPTDPDSTQPIPQWQLRADGTLADGSQVGDQFAFMATASDTSGNGVTFQFTVTYVVYNIYKQQSRFGPIYWSYYKVFSDPDNQLYGGVGTVTGPNPPAVLIQGGTGGGRTP